MLFGPGTFGNNVYFTHELFPSVDKPLAIEKYTLENSSGKEITVDIEEFEKVTRSHREMSLYDVYEISAKSAGAGIFTLKDLTAFGGNKIDISITRSGKKINVRITSEGKILKNISVENGTKVEGKL